MTQDNNSFDANVFTITKEGVITGFSSTGVSKYGQLSENADIEILGIVNYQ